MSSSCQMGQEEGREVCWVSLNIFSHIISLFYLSFFFFHDGNLLGNASETMQGKMVFKLAAPSGVESVPQLTRQVNLVSSKDLGVVSKALYFKLLLTIILNHNLMVCSFLCGNILTMTLCLYFVCSTLALYKFYEQLLLSLKPQKQQAVIIIV